MADEYLAQGIHSRLETIAVSIGVDAENIWNENPKQDPDYPMIIFDIVDEGEFGRSHDVGVAGFNEARVQIDIYATTKHEAETIMGKLKAAWRHHVGTLGVTGFEDVSIRFANRNPGDTYEEEATLRNVVKRSLDFFVQY